MTRVTSPTLSDIDKLIIDRNHADYNCYLFILNYVEQLPYKIKDEAYRLLDNRSKLNDDVLQAMLDYKDDQPVDNISIKSDGS